MNYLDFIVSGSAAILSLGLVLYHLLKRKKTAINGIFSLSMFFAAAIFGSYLAYLLPAVITGSLIPAKIMASSPPLFFTALFFLVLAYPFVSKKSMYLPMALACIPGMAAAIACAASEAVITMVSGNAVRGEFFPAYQGVLALYGCGMLIVLLFKSFTTMDRAFSVELFLFFAGTAGSMAAIVLSLFFLPADGSGIIPVGSSVILSTIFLIMLMHTAISDIESLDMREFYQRTAYWAFIIALLFIPVSLVIYYRDMLPAGWHVPTAVLSFAIFIYLFLFYKYAKPRIDQIFQSRRRNLIDRMNDSFLSIADFSVKEEKFLWTDFLRSSMMKLFSNFDIERGVLYLLEKGSNSFTTIYAAGDRASFPDIEPDSPLLQALNSVQSTLTLSRFHTNIGLLPYKESSLKILESARIEMALPFFNHENKLIGLLLLGRSKRKKSYSNVHISVFELYRIQFQQQFLSIAILEEAKEKQAVEHDKMVVNSIKKTVIPSSMEQIEGIRVSSVYLDNSSRGCDYFDSIILNDGRLLIFLSDSSYSGIDSAIASLQLYSAMHTPTKYITTPDKILNIMNWLLASSSLTSSIVPAFALTYSKGGEIHYSCASGNPLYVYNPRAGSFSIYTTKGSPLGSRRDTVYEAGSFRTTSGSIGLLHSAGLTHSKNDRGESYSLDSIRGIIASATGDTPAVITRRIYDDYRSFMGNARFDHDISIILFKV